ITIENKGPETLRFKLADDRAFSLDFNARTVKNEPLKQTEDIIRKRTTNQTVYFREIAIESGEAYSFVENLKDYVEIESPSVYYIDLVFFPELYKTKTMSLHSNRLSLDVKPLPQASASSSLATAIVSAEVLKRQAISPDKVVEQTIIARQKGLWDQFFLYIDIESFVTKDKQRKVKYTSLSDIERIKMLENYKLDLMQERIDNIIVAIPERFAIEKTMYSQSEGSVSVIQWFNYNTFKEKKRYTYYVRQRDSIWSIYDYTVENLGTE
ncbi:MAG TPA: hypothetical protein DDW88_09470, partial [Treponema sp.]|nr:hypothetical protein [Treponema sp.]